MVTAVDDRDLDADNGITAENSVIERLFNALLGSGDIFLRHDSADDLVDPFKALALFERLDFKDDVAVLTFTAGLPDELALSPSGLADRFTVGDLRTPDLDLDIELPAQTVDDDFQMEFAHTADQRLPRLRLRRRGMSGLPRKAPQVPSQA